MEIKQQQDIAANNKRIAKNTLMLYIRMLFMMGVSLFTSRVILETLGVEDFGIYSVVGGIITMFAFINGGMVSATQRFITFEIGKGNVEKLKSVFSTSLQIHALISLIIILLGETVGLWFLYEKMVIPEARMDAAMWVYQCSIIACVVNIMSIPYNADIVAHEKMSAFAYISIVEVSLKLIIVYLLLLSPWDKLIVYAILLLLVQFSIRFVYSHYCHKHFEETNYKHQWNKLLLYEMISFAGWSFWGSLSVVLYTQGLNMLLNVFLGPVVNAARGIAVQVQSAVQQFTTNFQMALNPQITKNYAVGDLDQMHSLMFRSARFSFFLLFFLTLPLLIETNFVLTIWLKNVPRDTVVFTQLMIAISLIYTLANPCVTANQATGKVKVYQAVVGGILLLIVPISYVVLNMGAPAYSVFIVHFCVESIAQFARMIMLRKLIQLPLSAYLVNIYIPVILVISIATLLPFYVHTLFLEGWLRFIIVGLTSIFSVSLTVFTFGLTKGERHFFTNKAMSILKIK